MAAGKPILLNELVLRVVLRAIDLDKGLVLVEYQVLNGNAGQAWMGVGNVLTYSHPTLEPEITSFDDAARAIEKARRG